MIARRRHVERHPGRCQWLNAAPQAFELGIVDACPGVALVNQPTVSIVIGEQQRPEPGPGPFGIGPADDHKFLAVQAFDFQPQPAIVGA